MFRFLHAADLHLDSPLKTLEKYPGAPVEEARTATRGALVNLVDFAIAERVAFVVIAGDVYDGNWDDYRTGLFFNEQMIRLGRENISIYLISGNHDAETKMTRNLSDPPNVTRFPTHKPASFALSDYTVTLHGQGFATQSVTEDLSANYPPAEPGRFNVGLLHTSVDGREGHDNYAPCSLPGLVAKGYDYWALGHIHQREILRDKHPVVAFSGNLQGRHIGETGPKGCFLVEVDEQREIVRQEFRELDVFRWEHLTVDLTDCEETHDVRDRIWDAFQAIIPDLGGRTTAVRITLTGRTPLHTVFIGHQPEWTAELQSLAARISVPRFWVEKVRFQTQPLKTFKSETELAGPIAELSACLRDWGRQDAELDNLQEFFKDVRRSVPAELLTGEDGIRLDRAEWFQEILPHVEQLAIARLLDQEAS